MLDIRVKKETFSSIPQVHLIEIGSMPQLSDAEGFIKGLRQAEAILIDSHDYAIFLPFLEKYLAKTLKIKLQKLERASNPLSWLPILKTTPSAKLLRSVCQERRLSSSFRKEVQELELLNIPFQYHPSQQTILDSVAHLRLPWLWQGLVKDIKIISNHKKTFGPHKLSRLLQTEFTLAFTGPKEDLSDLLEQLAFLSRDTRRAMALVSHHPIESPQCWLTTVGEASDIFSQWLCQGVSSLYLEPDRRALQQLAGLRAFSMS